MENSMGLIYIDKSALELHFKDNELMFSLLDSINANLRKKARKYRYPNVKTEFVQTSF